MDATSSKIRQLFWTVFLLSYSSVSCSSGQDATGFWSQFQDPAAPSDENDYNAMFYAQFNEAATDEITDIPPDATCITNLNLADANSDQKLTRAEYLTFIQLQSECDPGTILEIPQSQNPFFVGLACLCLAQPGASFSCCTAENAIIDIPTQEQQLSVICNLRYLPGGPFCGVLPPQLQTDAPSTPSGLIVGSDAPSGAPNGGGGGPSAPTNAPVLLSSDFPSTEPSQSPVVISPTATSPVAEDTPSALPSSAPFLNREIPTTIPGEIIDTPSAFPIGIVDTPSNLPSSSPSLSPISLDTLSDSPSQVPSAGPVSAPSRIPSDSPIAAPSEIPSDLPSLGPVSSPSALPSDLPSVVPSSGPSGAPTVVIVGNPATIFPDATCSANPQCAARKLDGDCCPTIDGIFLQCCYETAAPLAAPSVTSFPTFTAVETTFVPTLNRDVEIPSPTTTGPINGIIFPPSSTPSDFPSLGGGSSAPSFVPSDIPSSNPFGTPSNTPSQAPFLRAGQPTAVDNSGTTAADLVRDTNADSATSAANLRFTYIGTFRFVIPILSSLAIFGL